MKENEANGEVVNGSGAKNGAAAATDKETLVVIDETLDVKAPSKGSQKGAGAEVKQVQPHHVLYFHCSIILLVFSGNLGWTCRTFGRSVESSSSIVLETLK